MAVKVGAVALPLVSVVTFTLVNPPVKVPLAPEAGAVNVTTTPLTPVPFAETIATSGWAKAVLMFALCGVPLLALITSWELEVFVRLKFAGAVAPVALAVTE